MELKIKNAHPYGQPDPYIFEDKGNFYIIATGADGVSLYKSNKLDGEYEYLGIAFKLDGYKEYWAPSVIKINDTFYMYVSCMKNEYEDSHMQTMMVATSKIAEGPYQFVKQLIAPFSIDSHPVLNESGLYLFYSANDYVSEKAGTRIFVDKMLSPLEIEGKPIEVVSPSLMQEIFMRDRFNKNQHWYTIEGACYFKEGDYQYLLYSANCYQNEYYYVAYAVAKSNEIDLRKVKFTKYPNENTYAPLLSSNDFESGTGHNSVIKYNGEWYIIYHGRNLDNTDTIHDVRTMRIGKIKIDNEKLEIIRNK